MQNSRKEPLKLVRMLKLPGNPEEHRQVTFLELDDNAPFAVRRVYWIHSLSAGEVRGNHAHRSMQQLLIAVNGSFRVTLDDGKDNREFTLSSPFQALWVPAGLWRHILTLADQSTLLVLASTHFDEADYIRDYPAFLAYTNAVVPSADV